MMRKTTTTICLSALLALFPVAASLFGPGVDDGDTTPMAAPAAEKGPWLLAAIGENAHLDALALAQKITEAQADALGERRPPRPATELSAGAAVLRIIELRGVSPSVETATAIAVLETAPEPLRSALTSLLADFAWYTAATQDAVAGVDTTGLDIRDPPSDLAFPLGEIMAAQSALLADAAVLRDALATSDTRLAMDVLLPGALAVRLTDACTDDVYTEDIPLLVDECGHDTYRNNGGGGHGAVCPSSLLNTNIMPAAALFDFAGNDSYESGRSCGINGGGALGAGLLYDEAGNDAYIAGNPPGWASPSGNDGVNGGGVIGSGLLVDAGGDDLYETGGWGTNGGAYPLSRALLLDDGLGTDTYIATFDTVNGAGTAGVGALCDMGGTDWYYQTDLDEAVGFDTTVVPKGAAGAQLDWS